MLNLNSQKNEAGLIECAQQCLMANKRRLPNVACVYTKRGAYRWRILTGIFTGLTLTATCALAASTDIADLPMSVKSIVPPNIMMMLDDSGSMNNIVPDTPYDPAAASISAPYVCPPGNRLSGGSALPSDTNAAWPDPPTDYLLQNSNGTLKVVDSNTTYTFGTTGSAKCFNPDQVYSARLNTLGESCGSGCTEAPTYYARGVYRGHYLNWYFSNTGGAWTSGLSKKPGTKSRMEIAKEASKGAIDLLTGVRLGLSTYNGSNGGSLLVQIGDIATNKTTVQTNIDGLSAGGSTPLAETLSDIGRYFATGYTGNLTLHQGQANQATASVASVFNNHEFLNSTGSSTLAAPIQKSCQKSFAMLMTDGRPDSDRYISSSLADYDGDCTGTNASNCSGGYDMKNGQTYEGSGSDYLDDVAQALYEMDLRPNLADPTGKAKTLANNNINNVSTYVIGFADPFVVNDPLVKATAEQGGGDFFAPKNAAELSRDFDTVLGDITGKVGAAAAVAVSNPNVAAGDNTLYTSSFHSGKWTGDLIAYNINTSTGLPDLVNPVWTNGCTTSQDTSWIDDNDHSRGKRGCSAQLQLDNTGVVTPTTRKIVTYTGTAGTGQGLQFQPNSATTTTKLSATQQTALNTSATVTDGTNVLSFVRGDRSREGTNYRVRGSRLGDIVNAEPVVINPPSRRYGDAGYTAFKTAKASRRRVVFQAANDGMLHAFDADRTVPGSGGDELWAYVPNIIINNIKGLSTKTGFAHRYYIDATPVIRDVNFNNTDGASGTTADWRTILVGGLGKGGRGYYALDVTDPTAATEAAAISKVLWEFPNSATSNSDKVDIGFSFGRPIITKTKAKGWVALVTSGYNNGADTGGDGKGHLFVLNARTGAVIKDIVTTAGSSATPSGLASISAFVLNASADNTVEYVYGGDLEGNVWRFNLTGDAISDWAATRLTTLVDSAGTAQSITTAPELAIVNVGSAKKRIVLVATGKFLSEKDIPGAAGVLASATQTQSVYGLIDNLTATPTISPLRSNLVQQTLTNVPRPSPLPANYVDKRAASNNSVDLSDATGAKKGWYIDLPTTAERVNTDPTLVAGTLVFTSNIPRLGECSPEGKSWLNFVNYATGGLVPGANFSSWDLGDYLSSRPVVFRIAPTATLGAPSLGNDGVGALTVDSTGRISVKDIPVDNTLPVGRRIGWQEVYE